MFDFFETMTYTNWNGSIWMVLFLICTLYLQIREKSMVKRTVFIYFPIVILLIIYNPITYYAYVKFFNTTAMIPYYCRLFLLMPIVFSVCYACICAISDLKRYKKYLGVLVIVVMIMCSGECIYLNTCYQKADNLSKIPEEILAICQVLENENTDIKVMAPASMVIYLRQVDASIKMPYGRVSLEDTPVEELISKDPQMDVVLNYALDMGCNYFICANTTEMVEALEDIDYKKTMETDSWIIVQIK